MPPETTTIELVGTKKMFKVALWTGDVIHLEQERDRPATVHRIVTPIEELSKLSPEHLFEELRDVLDKISKGEFFEHE